MDGLEEAYELELEAMLEGITFSAEVIANVQKLLK